MSDIDGSKVTTTQLIADPDDTSRQVNLKDEGSGQNSIKVNIASVDAASFTPSANARIDVVAAEALGGTFETVYSNSTAGFFFNTVLRFAGSDATIRAQVDGTDILNGTTGILLSDLEDNAIDSDATSQVPFTIWVWDGGKNVSLQFTQGVPYDTTFAILAKGPDDLDYGLVTRAET